MSQSIPSELRYTKDHEWVKLDGETILVGITDFAQSALGDIVFVELPEEGRELSTGETFGVVESIKSVSDLYAPLSGVVLAKNTDLEATPDLCNQNPYDSWMVKMSLANKAEFDQLLSASDYEAHCASLS